MAAWQADFELLPAEAPLPADYRSRLDALLPRGCSWSEDLEVWGAEDGHRVDVWREGAGGDARLRVDMRSYEPEWAARALAVALDLGRRLRPVWHSDAAEIGNAGELALALRGSPAFRFVEDPDAFLRRVALGSHEDA